MKTLIKNVILTDATGQRPGKIMLENGLIRKIYKEKGRVKTDFDTEIDGGGNVLMPGFFDSHAHLRDPGLTYKEGFETGLAAAAKGGFTTVCAMANTKPIIDDAPLLKETVHRANALGLTAVIQMCAATKAFGNEPVDYATLAELTPIFSNDGKNIDDPEVMKAALAASRDYGFVLATHCQPELQTVLRDIELLRECPGARLHVCHISRRETLAAIEAAKADGLNITCEVTAHHLYASGLDFRVHPPFRNRLDRLAMVAGAKSGSIDMIGTDHAPHTAEDKLKGAPGLVAFETAFAMIHTVFRNAGIPLTRLSEMMSAAPAKRLGIETGLLQEKYPGDLVLVDPDREWLIDPTTFVSKGHNTPFAGDKVIGQVLMTIKGGRIIYDHR